MSLSAQVVAELVAAGLSGQALVDACRRIEGADGVTVALTRPAVAASNSRKNATVGVAQNATVEPGAGAGRAPLAILRAAIANSSKLSRSASRVGAAILDRFDPKTGRCEIGMEALARVCGVHRATVHRAVAALIDAQLFDCIPYAGMGHCNAYLPRLGAGASTPLSQNAAAPAMRPSQDRDPISERNITPSGVKGGAVRRKKRRFEPDRRQTHLPLPIVGGLAQAGGVAPSGDMIRAKAVQRLLKVMEERHGGRPIKPDPEAWEAGIRAEIANPGSGAKAHDAVLMGSLEDRRRTGTGPPR